MFFAFVPFMACWNLYGNLMIRSEYFKVGGVDTTDDYYNYEDENFESQSSPEVNQITDISPQNSNEKVRIIYKVDNKTYSSDV